MRYGRLKKKINTNLKCPACKHVGMIQSGHGIGKGYKVHKRFTCEKCGFNTINPIKI